MKKEKWISVNDRLPEAYNDVLVSDGDDIYISCYSKKKNKWFSPIGIITHWMPLPEPPKQEKQ